uniref:Short cationic peptide-1g n=1 Tax=Cupiennius salei TaxID=6928 RepID=TXS1G_CUPSA|nr:RecName: Full=Short cationic peptide-1g; Short=SCP-1g; AltName: Full=Cupiennin 1-like peptide-1h; AltName: Full=Short cationic peptide-1h; Short=SCP-1h; AltName: Full=Truncated variant of Cupiennin 1 family [Cupiennius salei]
GFGSLFKFL